MKRNLFLKLTISLFLLTLFFPALPARADAPPPTPDTDRDGLSDDMETDGWRHLGGGPFTTDPFDADSDDDGLTDGEEKLYGTQPNDATSPGLYVRYDSSFETQQYFSPSDEMDEDEYGNPIRKYLPTLQGADRYIMTEAVVIRRGTTFHLGGPKEASLTIEGDGLTTLTPIRDTCQNSWAISVPESGTVGTYTMTLSLGDWNESIPLYVIFEFPSDLTSEEIEAYIYDDDSENKRDEVSVWWRTPDWSYYWIPETHSEQADPPDPPVDCSLYPDEPCSNWQYHYSKGYAQAFWTEHLTQKVFVKHAMQAIHGLTNYNDAVNALAHRADREFRTVYTRTHNNWSDALHKYDDGTGITMDGGACQDNANVYTTLLRSAGLAAKTFLKDYNKTEGHGEGGQIGTIYEYDHAILVWLDGEWRASRSYVSADSQDEYYPFDNGIIAPRDLYGFYSDYASDLIISSDHRWDWQDGNDGGGMVNTVWEGGGEGIPSDEFAWPNNNWDIEWNSIKPLEIKRSPYALILNYESWLGDDWAPSEWEDPPESNPEGRDARQTYFLPDGIPDPADPLENWPYNPEVTACSPSSEGTADCQAIQGAAAGQTASPQVTPDFSQLTYVTDPNYEPEKKAASFSGQFWHHGTDTDGDGDYDTLTVSIGLDIASPATFKVQADLYDDQNRWVGHAKWHGAKNTAVLEFPISKTSPPYTLESLRLYKSNGQLLDSRHYQAHRIETLDGAVDHGAISIGSSPGSGDLTTQTVTSTHTFSSTPVDTDGDGLYDQLEVQVSVSSDSAGTYRVEGLLVNQYDTPVAWSVSEPHALGVGESDMTLTFDGHILHDHLPFSPTTQALKLVAVKIYSGDLSPSTLEDEVAVAHTTEAYSREQFESESAGLFEDDMERGSATTDNWIAQSPWSLNSSVWHSPSHAWEASGAQNGSLSTISIDLSDYAVPTLRFNACYQMNSSSTGYVEASTNGVDWTSLTNYTDDTQPWIFQYLDLSAYGKETSLQLRFRTDSSPSLSWYVDDVFLNGRPAVTDAWFDYHPKPVTSGTDTTFEASYSSIDTTLPITYTWDFGDGTPSTVTNDPVTTHRYAAGGDYSVQLTVENPYDSHVTVEVVGAGDAVKDTSFSYDPTVPETNSDVTFTASVTPITATLPITYTWDFGDGSPEIVTNDATVTHSYSAGGNYPVHLTSSNGYGTATDQQTIEVKEGVATVSFTTSDPRIEDDPVTFYPSITPDTASQPVTYTWDFGDGSAPLVTTTAVVEHTFDHPATYEVSVTADNGYGTPATHSAPVAVDGRPVSDVSFTYGQTESTVIETETTFYAAYEPDNATQPVTYTWDFGDGTPPVDTSDATVTHDFQSNGVYNVQLTATNGWGSPVHYSDQITLPFDDDDDGLSNVFEKKTSHTDPEDADSDNDNRTDYEEWYGYTYAGYTPHPDHGQTITTDPNDPDTDDDGLWDDLEFTIGTHPRDADTDDDGLADGEEEGNGTTDPLDPDTDDDGLTDGEEVLTYHTNAMNPDSDNDNVDDWTEIHADGDPPADTDGDGLINALDPDDDDDDLPTIEEDPNGNGDPTDDDTDGDGAPDYLDPDSDDDGIPDGRDPAPGEPNYLIYLPIVLKE